MATRKNYFIDNVNGACRLCDREDNPDMVQCDECDRWFHQGCAKLTRLPKPNEPYLCVKCTDDYAKPATSASSASSTSSTLIASDAAVAALIEALKGSNLGTNTFMKRTALSQLPCFDGKAREWPKFKRAFEESTREAGFSNVENMNRLQQALKGEAEKCVRRLFLEPDNVPEIMNKLEENFGRADLIYDELLKDVLRVKVENQHKIPDLSDAIQDMIINLKAINKTAYLHDHRLVNELACKLPTDKHINWIQYKSTAIKPNELPTLEDFGKWLLPIAKVLNELPKRTERTKQSVNLHQFQSKGAQGLRKNQRSTNGTGLNGSATTTNTAQANDTTVTPSSSNVAARQWNTTATPCPCCEGSHALYRCFTFKRKPAREREEIAIRSEQCFACLSGNDHRSRDCRAARECGIEGCKEMHHRLLHLPTESNTNCHQAPQNIFYQIVPVVLRNGIRTVKTLAFLDAGSSLSLIEEETANELRLDGPTDPLTMTWTQNMSIRESGSKRVSCTIRGEREKKEHVLDKLRTVKNLQLPQQSMDCTTLVQRYPHLRGITVGAYERARPTVLIGLNHSHLLMPLGRKMGRSDEPMAIKTKLGWIIFGLDTNMPEPSPNQVMIHYEEEAMTNMMRRYFSTEDFGVRSVPTVKSTEMERAENIIANTLVKTEGRYEIGLLWKQDDIHFPDSYQAALRRLEGQEKQLQKNPDLKVWLRETFRRYLEQGYLRKLSKEEAVLHGPRTFYLPHFVVVNRNKPVPKPRLVFDAAARVKDVSLNSFLLTGPNEMPSLFGVLLRFREGDIAITGDIKEMFHQVKVRKEDQDAQRILWRDGDASKRPDVYVMQVMTFGATCSPSCAQVVKNHNAEDHKATHPLALQPIVHQHYVDDYLDSFFELEDAIETVKQVREVHAKGGFMIRNFISNNASLINVIPPDHRSQHKLVDFKEKDQCVEKILGVQWNTQLDTFGYKVDVERLRSGAEGSLPTKREVLSMVMSTYDPLGLINHLTIQGRILMQAVHLAVDDWDAKIPDSLAAKWHQWRELMKGAKDLAIPRNLTVSGKSPIDLHVFVDASLDAFAACVYARSCFRDCYVVRLVAAKACVAPVHALTIPKLELQAAVLGTRLADTVRKELRLSVRSTTFWTDSKTVLAWINSQHRDYKQFVAHRVSEILDTTRMSQWRWVPTKENPADAATKLVSFPGTGEQWFNGPDFLSEHEREWPGHQSTPTTEEEKRLITIPSLYHREAVIPEVTNDNAPDGQVRVVTVKTEGGELKRPATKVAVVDVTPKEHLLATRNSPAATIKRAAEIPSSSGETSSKKKYIAPCTWATNLLASEQP